MRFASTILARVATGFLAACTSEEACTQDLATRKATDLTTRIQEIAAPDPAKLVELAPKVQDLAARATAGGDDLATTCKALDQMMAELSK